MGKKKPAAVPAPVVTVYEPTAEGYVKKAVPADIVERQRLADMVMTAPDLKPQKNAPGRKVGWRWRSPCGLFGVVHIANGNGVDHDYVLEVVSGSCVTLTKYEAMGRKKVYTVLYGKVRHCGCESAQNLRDATTHCKHVLAMCSLRESGLI